jgi:hypothetical protein
VDTKYEIPSDLPFIEKGGIPLFGKEGAGEISEGYG